MSADDRCELLCLDVEKAEALRRSRIDSAAAEQLSLGYKALSDPTRLTIALALSQADGELCVCDLAWITERAENLVSHHLRQLHSAGMVVRRREGKMVMYSMNDRGARMTAEALAGDGLSV